MAEYEISKAELIELIRRDCDTCLAFYLGEKLTLDVPEFHREIWDEFLTLLDEVNDPKKLTGILSKLLGVPREHAKTTLTKIAMVIFFRYSRLSFLAYISNTFGAALNALKDIKSYLESPQDQELYGPLFIEKSSDSVGEMILHIYTPIQQKPKVIIMKAFGVNTQIRGTVLKDLRPDLMVFDDCESRETVDSPTQQAKLDAWCLGTAMKSMAKVGICIFIGNMLAETSLLARLAKEDSWRAVVFGSIIKGADGTLQALWGPSKDYDPEDPSTHGRWTLEALLNDYAQYRRLGNGHIWEAEMMNLTAQDILGESLANAIRPPHPAASELTDGFICLDPAFGEKAWHDSSAITVHAHILGLDIPCLIDSWSGKGNEAVLLDKMIEFSFTWGITTWAIESVAAQRLFLPLFRSMLVNRKMSPETFVMIPLSAGKESKVSRIVAMRSAIASGNYAVTETQQDVIELMEAYVPSVKHEDVEDSTAFGNLVWQHHGGLVKSQGRQDVAGLLFGHEGGHEVMSGLDMGV